MTILIVLIIAVIVVFAIKGSLKHIKGEGGCCGGGATVKAKAKKLEGPVLGTKTLHIEGMMCENCRNNVERSVNDIDGAACKVNLKEGTAVVSFDRQIDDEAIRHAVEKLNYTVVSID